MNSDKCLYTSSKGTSSQYTGKPMDLLKPSSSTSKSFENHPVENEGSSVVFPIVKHSDNSRILPRYTAVLGRSCNDGVCMEDLDQLQQDLEKLLSTSAARRPMLKFDYDYEEKKDKKSEPLDKTSFKRKRSDEKLKYKDNRSGIKLLKNLPMNSFVNELPITYEVPKENFPYNDVTDQFWLSMKPHCADVTNSDVAFLDKLVQECSHKVVTAVPPLGDHYAVKWAEDVWSAEKCRGNALQEKVEHSTRNERKKIEISSVIDTFSNPLTQRLLAALIEEQEITEYPSATDKLKPSDFGVVKNTNRTQAGVCMDRRLRMELVEQGILDIEDLPRSVSQDDEVLSEIRKCQQELGAVNERNVAELSKLKDLVLKDQERLELKKSLDKIDLQVIDRHNKIIAAKQKQGTLDGDGKPIMPKLNSREFEAEANSIIQQQTILHRKITKLSDFSLLY